MIGTLPLATLFDAADRAERIGVGGDEVLVAAGIIGREAYLRRLAAWLGLQFAALDGEDDRPGDLIPPPQALAAGFVALRRTPSGLLIAAAPQGRRIRDLVQLARTLPATGNTLHLTSPERLEAYVLRHAGRRLAEAAAFDLKRRAPDLSAAVRRGRRHLPAAIGGGIILAALLAAGAAGAVTQIVLSFVFLGWIALRVLALMHADNARPPRLTCPDSDLPRYTIVVPLYREAPMVAPLLAALGALDYPREKLDILLVIEADDAETRAAIEKAGAAPHVRVVVSPAPGPRTKPKALNAALAFARGEHLVVYDAEDRPEPGQLRHAVAAFREGGPALACVQARLAIENARDGWLTRLFAGEYAGQFDVLLPMVTAHHLPLPLGGTSNHFRADVLRRVGGWDAFNVTEDADLGIRLARFGWQTGLIASTTWEEAPRRLPAWLRQRTRWFKGWMQTWLVHMRRPRRLLGELGLTGFLAFQLMIGGSVLSALVHPLFVLVLALHAAEGFATASGGVGVLLAGLTVATLTFGYLTSAALALAGLGRRRLLSIGWVAATMPVYWLLLSAAAWRAAWQLAVDPFHWEKTEHGLALTSVRQAGAPEDERKRDGRRIGGDVLAGKAG
ncbi:hypothetical protein BLTE_31950 [Blastochloris tepida]|uniref:Uncharacterized protein n=2 Tax=Blastochloris tepida TaxID=2233851 RepID=A0A348G4M7_9HYPH|nr:hypothetical protein BLTE_31950 [Blastochloris tepida]